MTGYNEICSLCQGNGYIKVRVNTEYQIKFPFVVQSVMVHHPAGAGTLYVYFQSQSAGNVISKRHYVELNRSSVTFDVKCKEIYIKSIGATDNRYQLFAELTNIPTSSMFHLTGSGITE